MSHRATTNPLPGVESRPGSGHYGVFDHGAHVWAWRPDGAAPVLWMSAQSLFVADKGIRGGVPICFPWFGAGRTGSLTPAHGVARINRWRREAVEDAGEVLRVGYSLDPSVTCTVPAATAPRWAPAGCAHRAQPTSPTCSAATTPGLRCTPRPNPERPHRRSSPTLPEQRNLLCPPLPSPPPRQPPS